MNFIPHNTLCFDHAESEAAARVVSSGYWAYGPEVKALEDALCDFFQVKYAVCVSSGVAALRLALLSKGQKGQCAVPAYSCVATANAALAAGYSPAPIDLPDDGYNISLAKVECNTSIVVNTFGVPATINKPRGFVIEDCSHGFCYDYTAYKGSVRGHAAIISFYATKLIGGGEGGVILTDDDQIASFVRDHRDYTDKPADGTRLNDKMSDIHAAVILSQFKKLPDFLSKRQSLAQRYNGAFLNLKYFTAPAMRRDAVHYRYVLRLAPQQSLKRVIEILDARKIGACEPVELWVVHPEDYPNAAHAYKTALSIPLYPALTDDAQDYIIQTIREIDEQLD